nr:Uncharacterised protein [Klebsiella pneumoniae]
MIDPTYSQGKVKRRLWREMYHNNERGQGARGSGKAGKREWKNVISVGFQVGGIG